MLTNKNNTESTAVETTVTIATVTYKLPDPEEICVDIEQLLKKLSQKPLFPVLLEKRSSPTIDENLERIRASIMYGVSPLNLDSTTPTPPPTQFASGHKDDDEDQELVNINAAATDEPINDLLIRAASRSSTSPTNDEQRFEFYPLTENLILILNEIKINIEKHGVKYLASAEFQIDLKSLNRVALPISKDEAKNSYIAIKVRPILKKLNEYEKGFLDKTMARLKAQADAEYAQEAVAAEEALRIAKAKQAAEELKRQSSNSSWSLAAYTDNGTAANTKKEPKPDSRPSSPSNCLVM